MKYLIKHFLTALIFAAALSSCDKDNDDSPISSNLIGTWEHKKTEEWGHFLWRITFHSNYTGYDFSEETYEGEKYTGSVNFTWSVAGTHLTRLFDEVGELFTCTYSGSGNHV
jgi:hypothetical protein